MDESVSVTSVIVSPVMLLVPEPVLLSCSRDVVVRRFRRAPCEFQAGMEFIAYSRIHRRIRYPECYGNIRRFTGILRLTLFGHLEFHRLNIIIFYARRFRCYFSCTQYRNIRVVHYKTVIALWY